MNRVTLHMVQTRATGEVPWEIDSVHLTHNRATQVLKRLTDAGWPVDRVRIHSINVSLRAVQ